AGVSAVNGPLILRWASPTGTHGMPTPDELRYFGYEPFPCRCGCGEPVRDPRYGSVLMRRDSATRRLRGGSVSDYQAFLASKTVTAPTRGLAAVPPLAAHLFAFQRDCTAFLLRAGSGGLFLDTGLGKTRCELEWCLHAAATTNGRALILTPLAVARQHEREGLALGYPVRVVRSQDDVREGINVCNYDRLDTLDPTAFGAIALDESSILKNFTGETTRALIGAFGGHRFRLSATATPAPNDHAELAQHAAFLGVMARDEMLVRWFINDSGDTKSWRLKGHAVGPFFDWMVSWARMAGHPRDLGDDQPGFDLPPLRLHRHRAFESPDLPTDGLFGTLVSATTMHDVKRATAEARADVAARLVKDDGGEPWVVWCDTNYEADALVRAIPEAVDVRGSQTISRKEDTLAAFADGGARVIITKPSVAGHGLNWQHCARVIFVGRSFSYEAWYQAVRRCWRFGQARSVDVHLVVAEGEDQIGRVIDRKADEHTAMKAAMVAAMRRALGTEAAVRVAYTPTHSGRLPAWMTP
ncbi:MAG: helicase-related protein, partial [Vicinamibacterales bacterium]